MNFQGKEAISRPTRATGRTVLLFSFLLGLAGLGWIEVANNSLVGLKVKEENFISLLQLLCGLSIIAHVVQWYSDYISYCGWNVTGKMPGGSRWDAPSETKLQDLIDEITVLPEGEKDIVKLSDRLKEVEVKIEELRWNIKNFDLFAKFYVFGWHLILPLGIAFIAFFIDRHA